MNWIDVLRSAKAAKAFVATPVTDTELRVARALSSTYASFLGTYGAIQTFPRRRAYGLHVIAPRAIERVGLHLNEIGNDDGTPIYLVHGAVNIIVDDELEQIAPDFDTWIAESTERLRSQYKRAAWATIVNGAKPFTTKEQAIIDARRKFEVTVDGVEPDDRIRLRIHNGSERVLSRLTYGVRAPDLLGALWLDVSKLNPRDTQTQVVDAYRAQADPRTIELVLDEPTPETRADFAELGDA